VLASGSADFSVKVWDMTTRACSHTFTHHSDKVQCVQWHPVEAWLLATGSFDGTVCLLDCRSAQVSMRMSISILE
jgi:periodic tryptophan protein 1